MNINYNDHILVIDNALSDDVCDNVIKAVDYSNRGKLDRTEENSIKRKDIQWQGNSILDGLITIQKDNTDKFIKCLNDSLMQYGYVNEIVRNFYLETSGISFSSFKVQFTPIGGGFHSWHFEDYMNKTRFLVWSLFLNDVNEGGELEFLQYSRRIKAKKGTMCLFPCGFTHTHRGNPPISNDKWIATGWYEYFPKENY